MLAGEGARVWAAQRGLEAAESREQAAQVGQTCKCAKLPVPIPILI